MTVHRIRKHAIYAVMADRKLASSAVRNEFIREKSKISNLVGEDPQPGGFVQINLGLPVLKFSGVIFTSDCENLPV